MKHRSLCTLAFLFTASAMAADTAYTALRVVGKRDKDLLNRVVEMRGMGAAPQPESWRISVDDPRARGGVREYEVRSGKVVSERTPIGRSNGAAMNFNQLNLDSEGVFTLINQETQKAGVLFERVDYLLKSGTGGGAPVWDVTLHEGRSDVGRMTIAADSGTVLQKQITPGNRTQRLETTPDRDYVDRRTPPPPPQEDARWQQPQGEGGWSQPGEQFRGARDFFHRVGKRFERRGEGLKNFFTGERP